MEHTDQEIIFYLWQGWTLFWAFPWRTCD